MGERRACRVIEQPRATQRYKFIQNDFDVFIRKRTIEIFREYGRYGYERVTEIIKLEGYAVNKKRIELFAPRRIKSSLQTTEARKVMVGRWIDNTSQTGI